MDKCPKAQDLKAEIFNERIEEDAMKVKDGCVNIPWMKSASKRLRYLVGVSGGADSVALLHLLAEAGFKNLIVCHLDHGLRGRASSADARFVSRLAAKQGYVLEMDRVKLKARMKEQGQSLETAARHARHEFFAACARKHRCNRVLLAHHADDQAETILWNLLRGSYGLRGMSEEQGIQVARKSLTLFRPLLGLRKTEIVKWMRERGLGWCEDASNAEPIAVRNRLRHEAIPLLEEISRRDVVAALVRGAADASEWLGFLEESAKSVEALDPQGRLHLPTLRKLHPVMQRSILRDYLETQGVAAIDRDLLNRGLALLDSGHDPAINLPGGRQLRRRAARLWVEG